MIFAITMFLIVHCNTFQQFVSLLTVYVGVICVVETHIITSKYLLILLYDWILGNLACFHGNSCYGDYKKHLIYFYDSRI